MQEVISNVSVFIMFSICTIEDLKNKKICTWQLLCFFIEGVILRCAICRQPLTDILLGMIPGVLLFLFSFLSRGNIGIGDGLLLLVTGIFLGVADTVRVFIYAIILCFGFALYLYLIKKKSRHYEIPFVPFMLAAFICVSMLGGTSQ